MYADTDIISKIKNVIKLAHNVAISEGVPLRADHIRSALRANGYTIPTPGSKIDNSLYDYYSRFEGM
jgi:hypothetical protein